MDRKELLRMVRVLVLLVPGSVWIAPSLHGQGGTTGTLVGLVSDPSGAVVPGVAVSVRSLETNITTTETTGEAGVFTFPNLRAGFYELKAAKQGFRTATVSSVKLDVNAAFRVNIALEVGEMTETVHVTTAAPTLQTDEATVGHLIEHQRTSVPQQFSRHGSLSRALLTASAIPTSFPMERIGQPKQGFKDSAKGSPTCFQLFRT